ncbi:MAG: hypothetical protein H6877_13275 [Rhodobiaceae bacterium]|nr:hypothetical protein [Rhodobiaceae bacterium]MCC0062019.1 hypothetical protein [Rhodobiaceae bacterium]
MDESEEIADALKNQGLTLVGKPVEDKEGRGHLVFVSVSFDEGGKQSPTNYEISRAEALVESILGDISIILVSEKGNDFKNNIKSMLIRRYSKQIRNIFTSVKGNKVSLWIEPKADIAETQIREIENRARDFLRIFNLSLDHFTNTRQNNTPSNTACLNLIRKKAPLSQDQLEIELRERGFDVPTQDWLAKNLDRWRKGQLIHRRADGGYVMTVKGLKALGSGKNRRSPDIARALDMARRQS